MVVVVVIVVGSCLGQARGTGGSAFVAVGMEKRVVKAILMTQLHLCLVTQVVWQMVLAQLVSEVLCVNLALLCWIGCAPEEVASVHEVKAVTSSCHALPVHRRGRGANGLRKTGRCFIMVLVALVAAVTSC